MNEEHLREALVEARGTILEQEEMIARILTAPTVYATVVEAENEFNIKAFEKGDMVLIIDPKVRKKEKANYGRIVSNGINPETGEVLIATQNGNMITLTTGVADTPVQTKLLGKKDGTHCVIVVDGKLFEVHGVPGKKFHPSERVKVDMSTYQIHDTTGIGGSGGISSVTRAVDERHFEVDVSGQQRVVLTTLKDKLEPGDRVVLDQSNTVIVKKLDREGQDRFNLCEEVSVQWNDIAGLGDVKEALIEAIELPFLHPEVFAHYKKKPSKGVALFGPPGCGKTMCGKAAATRLAAIHKCKTMQSGFIYVKGPELLSKYVGIAEQQIRELFMRAKDHHLKNGYPAIIFVDEADAIMQQRGSGRSSDVENTIVPMWLAEMDSMEKPHAMVIIATNQPNRLDPAIIRDGRINRKIKVGRPTIKTSGEYFKLHLKGVPLYKTELAEVSAITTSEIFDGGRKLYRLTEANGGKQHNLTLGHCISGAMIAGIVDRATSFAVKRDLAHSKKSLTGVMLEDFRNAVQAAYLEHVNTNATFDIDDFVDTNAIAREGLEVQKLFPND